MEMPEKRLTRAHGRCFLSRSRFTVASLACCLLVIVLLLASALVVSMGRLGMGNFLPLKTVLLVAGIASLFGLCIGAACRRRKTVKRGEPETGAKGPQLHVVTLMQRTRLDEQELARREWRMREEDRRQEKEQMEKERQEKDQLEAEMTRAEEITSSVGRWRQDGTRIADGIDAWQKPLFVVKKMGGENDNRGVSVEPEVLKQVTVHVHQSW